MKSHIVRLNNKLAFIIFLALTLMFLNLSLKSVSAEDHIQIGQFMFSADTGSITNLEGTDEDTKVVLGNDGIVAILNSQNGTVADITVSNANNLNESIVRNLDLSNYSGKLTLDNIELIGNGKQPAVQLTNAPINGCTLVIKNGTKIAGGTGYAIRGANTATPTGEWGSTIELHDVKEGDITSNSISDLSGYTSSQDYRSSNLGAVINPGNQGSLTIKSYGENIIKNSANNGYQNWPIISPYINTGTIELNFVGDGSLTLDGVSCNGCIHLGPQYPQDKGIAKVNIYSGTLIAKHSVGGGAGIIVDGHNPESSLNVYGGTFKSFGSANCDPSCGVYVNENGSANFYGGTTIAKGENCNGGGQWGANGIHAGRVTIQNGGEDEGPTVISIGGSVNNDPVPAFGVTTGISGVPTTTTRKPVNPTIKTSDGESFYPWLAQSYSVDSDISVIPDNSTEVTTNGNVIEGFAGGSNEVDLTTQRWVKISPQKLNEISIHNDPFVSSINSYEMTEEGTPTHEILNNKYKTFKVIAIPSFAGIDIDQYSNKVNLPIEIPENISKLADDTYYVKPSSKGNKLELTVANEEFFTKNCPAIKINKGNLNIGYTAFVETNPSYGVFKSNNKHVSKENNSVIDQFVTANDGSGILTSSSDYEGNNAKIKSFSELIIATDKTVPLIGMVNKDTNQNIDLTNVSLDHNSNLKAVYLTKLSLKPDKLDFKVGDSEMIRVESTPTLSSNYKINWSSNNPDIAEVDDNGKVYAKSEGTTIVIAEVEGKEAQCKITVKAKTPQVNQPNESTTPSVPTVSPTPAPPMNNPQDTNIKVTGVKLDKEKASLEIETTVQLKATVYPENASNRKIKWISSDSSIAYVSEDGIVTAKKEGTVKITVRTEDESKTAVCIITVKSKQNQTEDTNKPNNQNKPEESDQPSSQKPNEVQAVKVYRLYNEQNNEHLFTTDLNEVKVLSSSDWKNEGNSWNAPIKGEPVFRLYNTILNEHLYTGDENEVSILKNSGWIVDNNEQPLFYSGGPKPIYRLYHEGIMKHHLTSDENEYNVLKSQGWNDEGIALYSL